MVNVTVQYIHHTCLPAPLTSKGKLLASVLIFGIMNSIFKSLIGCFNEVSVAGYLNGDDTSLAVTGQRNSLSSFDNVIAALEIR